MQGATPVRETRVERVIAAVLRATLRATLLPTFRAGRPIADQRRRMVRICRMTLPPRGVDYEPAECGGVRGELVRARQGEPAGAAILYLHGGAYCVGSPGTHRAITGTLARLTGATVFAADYRLAPEHPCPAAVEDAVAAFGGLVGRGFAARRIALAGDSAGGGLAFATALRMRERGDPSPAAIVAFSPLVDLGEHDRGAAPPGEAMITAEWVRECARLYLGPLDPRDPRASPVFGDLRGLPPTLVQVGTDELLLADSRRIHEALRGAGVDATLQEFPRRWHVFQVNAGVLADADRALDASAQFLRSHWRNA